MSEVDEVIEAFLIESQEGLDQLDRDLVDLESGPADRELVARIFRAAHTIKGTSGFLGFSHLEHVTHAGESLLSRVRDGVLVVSPEVTTQLLAMVDAIREMLGTIRQHGNDGERDYAELVEALRRAANPELAPTPAPLAAPPAELAPALLEPAESAGAAPSPPAARKAKKRRARASAVSSALELVSPAPAARCEPAAMLEMPPALAPVSEPRPEEARREPAAAALVPDRARADAEPRAAAPETVRVDVALLDRLMDLAGELVLTRNQIRELQGNHADRAMTAAAQRLNLVTMGIQDGIMRMRMQPIDNVFSKLPRLVRDVARSCEKQVRLEMDGKNTELDKTLIEAIKDPLTHLLRNSVDHGIERPDKRVAAGKHPEGLVLVRAYHQGGQVNIEISDDGGGIPLDRVRDKALSNGMITPERAASMSEKEIVHLIFLPGFSTAAALTHVSGRGVGMDVVKTNVERIGGTVEVETRLGLGTTFRIKVPLTLAIVPAVIVASGEERYAIPQVSLIELVLVDAERKQGIERLHGAPVYRLRDKLLPLVFLAEQLALSSADDCFERSKCHIAVLQFGGRQFGLVVDRVTDSQEIVVKPLMPRLKSLNVFAGATILGDGRAVLILDVAGLATRAGLTEERDEHRAASADGAASAGASAVRQSLLLVRGPDDARIALPLERVVRLETVSAESLEEASTGDVLQYGDEIMPVVHLGELLPERRRTPRHPAPPTVPELLSLVVLSTAGGHVGLTVDDVLDVVDVRADIKTNGGRAGTRGTIVVQKRVTELLDLDWLAARVGSPAAAADALMEVG